MLTNEPLQQSADVELGTYKEKLKALALCRPGEENAKGRYN